MPIIGIAYETKIGFEMLDGDYRRMRFLKSSKGECNGDSQEVQGRVMSGCNWWNCKWPRLFVSGRCERGSYVGGKDGREGLGGGCCLGT